jgi:hypothetical protein
MARGRSYEPINPREAFNVESPDSYMSQAAFLLCVGAAVGGKTRHVPRDDHFPLPPLQPMARRGPIRLERIVRRLDVSLDEYVSRRSPISSAMAAHLARELYEKPDPYTAAALVEAGLRSRHPVVQTAGAVAALDTTGAREDVIAVLEGSAKASDPDVRDLARTGLARAEPNHRLLHRYVGRRRIPRQRGERSNTAVISHGTWAANAQWWKPGGEFYKFLDAITPSLHLHDKSFGWSGDYSHAQRSLAADDLRRWVQTEQLVRPDYFAHSHGGTVANLATQRGLDLSCLVFLGYPVHGPWLPAITKVKRIIDIRVHFDVVILADGGGQRLPANVRNNPKVTEARNGWFSHSASHEPNYWLKYGLTTLL